MLQFKKKRLKRLQNSAHYKKNSFVLLRIKFYVLQFYAFTNKNKQQRMSRMYSKGNEDQSKKKLRNQQLK